MIWSCLAAQAEYVKSEAPALIVSGSRLVCSICYDLWLPHVHTNTIPALPTELLYHQIIPIERKKQKTDIKMTLKFGLLALASIIDNASALIAQGPCMNDVWQGAENSGTELSCNANEVTTTVLSIDGPTYCEKGEIIVVNVTTSIYFRASRFDFAIYTLTDNSGASDPIFGSECAIDVLGQKDADFAPDNIINQDSDTCFDVVATSGWTLENFKFQDNLKVPCEGEIGKMKNVCI